MASRNRIFDIHSHILPGIDDGAQTFDDSIGIVKWLTEQGVTDIITTPHYIHETDYDSPKSKNSKLLIELKKKLKAEGIKVNISLGNEIYINDKISELIKEKKISPLNSSKYLLIEMPLDEEFPNYEDYFRVLIDEGYKVILAHPERYYIIEKDYEIVKRLHEMGVLLQCNAGSILGRYGRLAKKIAKRMAKDKLIFTISSDAHRRGSKDYLVLARKKLSRYLNDDEMKQILQNNPEKIKKVTTKKATKKTAKKSTKKSAKK